MSEERCKEEIRGGDPWTTNTCSRKAALDGYCKQHHPDTAAARRKKRDDAYAEVATKRKRTHNRERAKQDLMDAVLAEDGSAADAAIALYRANIEPEDGER